ncbi:MAG: class I SAM-dependent methyltransferase [Magnetococcales bacterium]|nr:class I SAM-dependent methyltransferase [Magnetococcales bacterium]
MNSKPISYDEIPYESKPLEQSRPAHLYAIGCLFGMQPPDFRRARVLEIGCASGVNLLPMAALHPQASFLGIDLSRKQIETGQHFLTELGLTNVTLRQVSIADLAEEPFDYIICHGVLSWVDATVQQAILHKTSRLLTENGIAYISYNTLPGWNMVRSLREMMQFHTQNMADPTLKAAQAHMLLTFLRDNAAFDIQSPYRQLLSGEIDLLAGKSARYLLHDHLEYHNIPLYFHQFNEMANRVGLQYLGEAQLPAMFMSHFTPEAQHLLGATDNIGLREQYMDFLTNRRFRMTLLCRDHIALQHHLTPHALAGFYLQSLMQPAPAHPDDAPGLSAFSTPQGARILTAHPVTIAVLTEMADRKRYPFRLPELITRVCQRWPEWTSQEVTTNLQEWSLSLLSNGGLVLNADAPPYVASVSAQPEAWFFARAQARHQDWVTSMRHEPTPLTPFAAKLLPLLDGTRTRADLLALLPLQINEEEFPVEHPAQPATDPSTHQARLHTLLAQQLDDFAQNALLVR